VHETRVTRERLWEAAEGVRGKAEVGLRATTASGVGLSGSFDGIDSSDDHAVAGKAAVRIPLN
jgi:hypothetical protein